MTIHQDRIELQPYDPSWPACYEAELARIRSALPAGVIRRAEHIGSTAVPGMLAKPVVDILLAVDDLERARESFPPLLESLGYAFWGDNPKRDRLFFVRGLPPAGPRMFHIHVTTPDSAMWDRVLFRDHLRISGDEARRYERLKEDLAAKFPEDREAYSEGKTEYHESVVAAARALQSRPVGELIARIQSLRPKKRRTAIVAIDGYGGSGKSALAAALAAGLPHSSSVRTDDFARPNVSGWDWKRMKSQVLDPLNEDRPGRYQRHDWDLDQLAEWHDLPVGGVVIVEGVSSMRQELGRYWDLAIWVTCPHAVRLARGIARDGEAKRSQWENVWIPEEDAYVASQKPEERADVVINGAAPFEL